MDFDESSSTVPLPTADQLSIFPEELWIQILDKMSGSRDIKSVLLAYPWLDHSLRKQKANYLVGGVMPFLMNWLPAKDVYSCRGVSPRWCDSVDKHIEARLVNNIRQVSDLQQGLGSRLVNTPNFYRKMEFDTPAKIGRFKTLLMSAQHPPVVAERNPFVGRALVIHPKAVVPVIHRLRMDEEFRVMARAEFEMQWQNMDVDLGMEFDSDDDDDELEQQDDPVPLFWSPIRDILKKHGRHLHKVEVYWNSIHREDTTYHPTFYNSVQFCQTIQDCVLKYLTNLKSLVLHGYNMEMDGLNASNYLSNPSCNFLNHSLASLENLDLTRLHVPHVLYNWIIGRFSHVKELAIWISDDPDWLDGHVFPNLRHVRLSNIKESQISSFGELIAAKLLSRAPALSSIRLKLAEKFDGIGLVSGTFTLDRDLLRWLSPYQNVKELEILGDGLRLDESEDCNDVSNYMPHLTSLKLYNFFVEYQRPVGEIHRFGYQSLLNFPNLERLHLQLKCLPKFGVLYSGTVPGRPFSRLSDEFKALIIDFEDIGNSKVWELLPKLRQITTTAFLSAEGSKQVFTRV